jgi:hypothetical protein
MAEAVLAEPVVVKPKRARKAAATTEVKPKRVRKPKVVETPIAEETGAPVDTLDRERLIDEEVTRVEQFYKDHPRALKSSLGVREYVTAVFNAHEDLIRRWGGWRMEFSLDGQVPRLTKAEIDRSIQDVIYAYGTYFNGVYDYRTGKYDKSKVIPQPLPNYVLYRSKAFNPDKGELEREFEYVKGFKVKIRKGQAVSKAVLGQVRKDFKGNEDMLRVFNRLFESLGQSWTGVRSLSLVHVSCAPVAFLLMGHYRSADTGSCFATSGVSERTKVNLSLFPNSVVLLYYGDALTPDQTPVDRLPDKAGCRMYGAFRDQFLMVSNIQQRSYGGWAAYYPLLVRLAQQELGLEKASVCGASTDSGYYTGYWEFNNLIASDGNMHIVAADKHPAHFTELKAELKKFAPEGHVKGGRSSYY